MNINGQLWSLKTLIKRELDLSHKKILRRGRIIEKYNHYINLKKDSEAIDRFPMNT